MIARTVIAASLCAIAPLYGCVQGEQPRPEKPASPPIFCTAEVSAKVDTPDHAAELANAALDRLLDGKQQEATACASDALRRANALPPVRPRSYDVDRENLVGTIAFLDWMARHWSRGGPKRVDMSADWKETLKRQFEHIASLSKPVRGGDAERERAVDVVMIGHTAMAHFDPDDELQKYADLLEHGRKLTESWTTEPETGFHRQMSILFDATVGSWPYVRAGDMDEIQRCCDPVKTVKEWHRDLSGPAKRAKDACAKWLGERDGAVGAP